MKKRKLVAAALAAVIAASLPLTGKMDNGLSVTAEAITIDTAEWLVTPNADGTVTLERYNGDETEIVIPSEIDGKTVTALGTEVGFAVFGNASEITSITIPESVKYVGSSAFAGCSKIESLTIPEGVEYIEHYTFSGCSSLKSVTLPNSIKQIVSYAFENCNSLESITIPEGVTWVASNAFKGCTSLKSFAVSAGNETYSSIDGVLFRNDNTFLSCYPIGKEGTSYVIPNGVTGINDYAFADSKLTDITISEGVETFGNSCFVRSNIHSLTIPASVIDMGGISDCGSLTEINVVEENTTYCSVDGVVYDKEMTTVICYPAGKEGTAFEFPETVKNTFYKAFAGSLYLENIILPEGMTSIADRCFFACLKLKSITIPNSVTYIDDYAFFDCRNLETVIYDGTDEDWDAIEICTGNDELIRAKTGVLPENPEPETKVFYPTLSEEELEQLGDDTDTINVLQSITVTADADAFDEDVEMHVSFIAKDDGSFSFDITFTKDGEEVQPASPVLVMMPVPDHLKNAGNIYVYHYDDNGRPTSVTYATVNYGILTFQAEHFSKYEITNTRRTSTSNPGANPGAGAGAGANPGAGSVTEPDTDTDTAPDTDATPDTDTGSDTSSDTNSDTDTDTNSNAASDTNAGNGSNTGSNPVTGIALAVAPIVLAAGAVIVTAKRKK